MILSILLYVYVLPLVIVASITSVLFFLGLAVEKEIVDVDAYVSCLFFACYPLVNIIVSVCLVAFFTGFLFYIVFLLLFNLLGYLF